MASKCISTLARSQLPSTHSHGLKVHICKLAQSWPPSASPDSLDYGVQVHLQTHSITASKIALSWPPSAYLQIRAITASKFKWSWPPTATPHSLDGSLQVYLHTRTIAASKFARSRPRSSALSWLDHSLLKWWSLKADSPSSTLCLTSQSILREFLRKSHSGSRSVGRGWEDMMGYLAMMNHTNCVDL